MADDARILELVEEALCSNRTPEEVCADDPELLADVRACLNECRRVEFLVERLFPSKPAPRASGPQSQPGAPLPEIPGYEVLAVLGRGGHGIVYRVRHLKLNRVAALKMLLTGEYASPAELARFTREAEAIAALQHPNIVQIYDVGEVDDRPYFTMEFAGGASLARNLGGVPQPARYSASVARSLARAVHAAHLAGIVHRDVKPSNVLLALDGTPKIGDFGLAQYFEGQADVTPGPAKVGTPGYMAPEQVFGKPGTVGPAADIYALGATLYELLTGRPPFRAESAAETERQVLTQEPAAPSKLNAKVPRDLETICLKCLRKEPARRYESASALADDLKRFEEGRPIHARPVGRVERSWRWGRRNPATAALLLTGLALVGLTSGGGAWVVRQRAEQRAEADRHYFDLRNGVSTALPQVASLRRQYHFREARELIEFARKRLEQAAGPEDLRRQANQCRADLDLAERLDAARTDWATLVEHEFKPAGSEALYESAFAAAGLGREGDDAGAMAARVRGSAASAEIIAALDDWASITPDPRRRAWLLAVARGADPDPARDRVRRPELWRDRAGLTQLARTLDPAELGPQLTTALCRVVRESGADPVPLMTAAQARFPQDFWLNLDLGWALHKANRLEEALGYYRAALALRPRTSVAHHNVGAVLSALGRREDAVSHFREALRLDPGYAAGHHSLAWTLRDMGRLDEAIDEYGRALRIAPTSSVIHNNFGVALRDTGRLGEAIRQFQESIRLDPAWPVPRFNLGSTLQASGRVDEAIEEYGQALRLDAGDVGTHVNLGSALCAKGRVDEAIDHFRQALRLDPNSAAAHVNLGSALYAMGRVEEAIDHFREALRLNPDSAAARVNLGVSLHAAARRAVLDAAGQGAGSPRLGEPDCADKRRQALAWLRADLELKTTMPGGGGSSAQSVAAWRTDPDLAGVRGPAALAKLPDAEREPWQRFWADVAAAVAADPVEQGRAPAAGREWVRAADGYARALKQGPTDDGHFWFEYAAVLLLSGDRAGYRAACTRLIDRCGKRGGPRAYHAARASTLAPESVPDALSPGRLAGDELRRNATQFWSLTELGALAYRSGELEQSASFFEQSLKADPRPGRAVVNWLWLSMAEQRLGRTDEARRRLEEARKWLDQYRDGMPAEADEGSGLDLHNWLEAHVLLREAEALLASK